MFDLRTDAQLLAATAREPEAFGVFYRRRLDWVLRFAARRTGSAELAADLTAETFAAALVASGRYREEAGAANNWLFGILLNKLAGFERRGAVEKRARRRLALSTPVLTDSEFDALFGPATDGPDPVALLERLPADQRIAVRERILDDRSYPELAERLGISEASAFSTTGAIQNWLSGSGSLRRARASGSAEGSPPYARNTERDDHARLRRRTGT